MSLYLQVPNWQGKITFQTFMDLGDGPVYPHWHKEIEIIYSLKGVTTIGVDSEIISLKSGEIYFFASGQPHYFLPSQNSIRLVYQFDLSIFDAKKIGYSNQCLASIFEQRQPWSAFWPNAVRKKVVDLLDYLFISWQNHSNVSILGNLYLLLAIFENEISKNSMSRTNIKNYSKTKYIEIIRRLNLIYDYIENNYQNNLTLDEIASVVGFNPQYFTRFFKENTGTTFLRFLNDYRLMQASYILVEEQIPMGEVAERCGFSSVKTFHHAFKNYANISPLQYRKEKQKST